MSAPDTRACEIRAVGVNVCVETFREALRESVAEDGLPCVVNITATTPEQPSAWLAAIECPHGVVYWVDPTPETVTAWEAARSWE